MRILNSILIILTSFMLPFTVTANNRIGENRYTPSPPYPEIHEGMSWPAGQALPQFASPDNMLDGLDIAESAMPTSEKVMFAALQGLVNKQKPRIFLYDAASEGKNKWPDLLHLNIKELPYDQRWELIKKYQNEIKGVIIYDTEKSIHYINLASTASGLKHALPVTEKEYTQLTTLNIQLPILADFRELNYTSASEIYKYLYETYWKDCTKRLLVSLNPRLSGYIRDIGIASETAIIWLDPRKEDENEVLQRYLQDMKAGESIIIGWWAEERSGIGSGTKHGISTIPADFYQNATVYAGMSHNIQIPAVPKKPLLENKIYLSIFLSDGDNVQYCQHAMSKLWDNKNRGIIPINWTVSPGLVDIGPGLLNYYYQTATSNDFFASGPSGLGYALIYDAHNKKWNMSVQKYVDAYTQFTQQYLEKSGLRVITIWDEVNDYQMDSYASHCRYLYGITLEDWQKHEPLATIHKEGKMAFIPNLPCYAENIDDIFKRWEKQIVDFDGTKPLFLTAQGESWKMGPENIVELKNRLEKLAPGKIVVCRGDHFFALYNEANKLNFNLTLSPEMKITSSGTTTNDAYAADGTASGKNVWISNVSTKKWIMFDFAKEYQINRYVIRHAGANGMNSALNTKSFKLEVSIDGTHWATANEYSNNSENVTDIDIAPVNARFVRIAILNAGSDGIARIADIEIYGKATAWSDLKRLTQDEDLSVREKQLLLLKTLPYLENSEQEILWLKSLIKLPRQAAIHVVQAISGKNFPFHRHFHLDDQERARFGSLFQEEDYSIALFYEGNFDDWKITDTDNKQAWVWKDGILSCHAHSNLRSEYPYGNFELSFEVSFEENSNNGIGFRSKGSHINEIQILDDEGSWHKGSIQDYQHHGSLYGIMPAKPGTLKPLGEWNSMKITIKDRHCTVESNGTIIVDGNMDEALEKMRQREGHSRSDTFAPLQNNIGELMFMGHDGPVVRFRNIRIKNLDPIISPE